MEKSARQIAHDVLCKRAFLLEPTTPSGDVRGDVKDTKNIFIPDNEEEVPSYEDYYEDEYTDYDDDYDYEENTGTLFSRDPVLKYKDAAWDMAKRLSGRMPTDELNLDRLQVDSPKLDLVDLDVLGKQGAAPVDGAPAQKYTRGRGGWRNVPQYSDVDPKYYRNSKQKEFIRMKLRGQ